MFIKLTAQEECVRREALGRSPNIVEHQALAVVEGDAHVPVEPADLIATHLKAGALGLHNVDRLLTCTEQTFLGTCSIQLMRLSLYACSGKFTDSNKAKVCACERSV